MADERPDKHRKRGNHRDLVHRSYSTDIAPTTTAIFREGAGTRSDACSPLYADAEEIPARRIPDTPGR